MCHEQIDGTPDFVKRQSHRGRPAQTVEQSTIREKRLLFDIRCVGIEQCHTIIDCKQHFKGGEIANTREVPLEE